MLQKAQLKLYPTNLGFAYKRQPNLLISHLVIQETGIRKKFASYLNVVDFSTIQIL